MCLVAQISKCRATEDIHVYKILRVIRDLNVDPEMRFSFDAKKIVAEIDINVDFVSPYYPQTHWEVGETKTLSEDPIGTFMFGNFIGFGYFHSYSQNEFEKVKKLCGGANLILFEATIPRGTSYYQGVVEYEGTESYASKALRIDKMVEGQQSVLESIKFRLKDFSLLS